MKLDFDPKKRYSVYYRASTSEQEHSIDGQEHELDAFAKSKGIEITCKYSDEGRTGTNMNRNGLQQLLEDAQNEMFDVLLVWRYDRICRQVEDFFHMMRIFRRHKIKVYSVKENLLYSNDDLLMCFFKSYEAGNFSVKLSEDSMRGLKLACREGRHLGGLPPYGLDVDPVTKKYVKNLAEAKIVNEMYERFNAGASFKAISEMLNLRGLRNKKGNNWKINNVRLILTSPKYLGHLTWRRTTNKDSFGNPARNIKVPESEVMKVEGVLPQIVDETVYKAAQARIKNNVGKAGAYRAKRTFILSGLCVCAECQANLSGQTRNSSGRAKTPYHSYICRNKKAKTCSTKEIPAIKLEKAVVNAVLPLIFNKHRFNKITKMINAAFHESSETKLKRADLQQSLDQCSVRRERFLDAIGSGMSIEALAPKIRDSELAMEKLQNEIDTIDNCKIVKKKNVKNIVSRLMKIDSDEVARQLKLFLVSFVDRIVVDNSKVEVWVNVDVGRKTCKLLKVKQP